MEKSDSLLKDFQGIKNEITSLPRQTSQQISKESTRFTSFQVSPAAAWSNCIGKTQNMLRGSGSGQETAGWFHFHKLATSGHDIYTPPIDMQQVYYQSGMPEMRSGCYAAQDPRSSYSQPPPTTGYTELRPPPQVVNQRFIQCVNHFTPGSRSLPCLLQPSYYGYDYGGPIQSGSDTLLTRVEPSDIARTQRYSQHHDLSGLVRPNKEQTCFRQPWDNDQACQSFLPRFQDGQTRKCKAFDCQEQSKNKDKASSFSYLATEVSKEIQWFIAAGGNNLSDILDFCKFVQSFIFISTIPISNRLQTIREMILSFIHVSSAYVHLSSVLLLAEQNNISQKEMENLRTSFSLWESATTSVVVALRALLHSLSDVKIPDLKKMQDMDDQSSLRQDLSYNSASDLPFMNYGSGDCFKYTSRNQYRSGMTMNQQFEFKRKYQHNTASNSQKDNNVFYESSLNPQKNVCLNLKSKSCNQLKVHNNLNVNGSSLKFTSKMRDQLCNSPDTSDSDKSKLNESHDFKHFCFNLLNPEKKKPKGKSLSDPNRQDKSVNSRNKVDYDRPCSKSSSKSSKQSSKEKSDEYSLHSFSQSSLDADTSIFVNSPKDNSVINQFPYLSQTKIKDWSFGVLNTGDKKLCQLKSELSKETDQTTSICNAGWTNSSNLQENITPEKPMSSEGEDIPAGRFLNPELNKALEDHCESARIQLKHKMLDILGFLQTCDESNESSNEKINEMKKNLQENLNSISYLVYTDRYRGVAEMMNAVRQLIHKTRIQNLNSVNAVRLVDDLEASFLDLFKKEFGCCSVLYPQSRDN